MIKWTISIACLAGLLAISPALRGQATPTATGSAGNFQVGVGALVLNPDYTNGSNGDNIGLAAYVDYDFYKFVGVEAEAHFEEFISPGDVTENSYMLGPRFSYHRHKLTAYAKLLTGRSVATNQDVPSSANYFDNKNGKDFNVYAFGGGLEYRLKRHINVRIIDYEIQKWGNFEPHTLSPTAYTFGIAYVIR